MATCGPIAACGAYIAPLSKQIALALFYEGRLVLAAWRRERNSRTGLMG
jgi:hypothetical protein